MPIFLNDIRPSYDLRYFGASLDGKSITIWKTDSAVPITTILPGFSGGENRHIIDPVNRLIYCGTWEDGLTCFDYANNLLVWHRRDLIGIQRVDLSTGFPTSLFVTLELPDHRLDESGILSGVVELDTADGSTKWTTKDGDHVYADPRQPILVIQDSKNDIIRIFNSTKSEVGAAPMINFVIIDVGFSEDLIALAEGAKGVRILNHKGEVISHYAPKNRKPNCIRVVFSECRVIVSDTWSKSFITIINPINGQVISEYERKSHGNIRFIDNGSRFIDQSGIIYRSLDGQPEFTISQ